MKKIMLFALLLMPAMGFSFEGVVVPSTSESRQDGLMDFRDIFDSTRVGVFLDQHANRMTGIYATLLGFNGSDGTEYVNMNVGYLKQVESKKDSPLIQIGFRVDNILAKARSSRWGQRHTKLSPLPAIEFGPYISAWFEREDGRIKTDLLYGVGLAIRL